MTINSRTKGHGYERECVKELEDLESSVKEVGNMLQSQKSKKLLSLMVSPAWSRKVIEKDQQ